jgi:hypothetical protein
LPFIYDEAEDESSARMTEMGITAHLPHGAIGRHGQEVHELVSEANRVVIMAKTLHLNKCLSYNDSVRWAGGMAALESDVDGSYGFQL